MKIKSSDFTLFQNYNLDKSEIVKQFDGYAYPQNQYY